MKPCIYRTEIEDEMFVGCGNNEQLIHNGFVRKTTCAVCPYAKAPEDVQSARSSIDGVRWYSEQTSSLYRKLWLDGVVFNQPKSCGGCGETKHRVPEQQVTQFVWPYWHAGAAGDEIRWSVRSVETFFQGTVKCTIIGDKPPWFHGHYIPQKRVSKRTPNRAFRDMLAKMWTMATHPDIQSDFVWMMDDIYLLKQCTAQDIQTPRATQWHPSESNSWQRRKTSTMNALEAAGRSTFDYATHLPHWVEKQKLHQVYEEFNLSQNTMLWEVLYGNTFRGTPQRLKPFFRRIVNPVSAEQLKRATEKSVILNHTSRCWSEDMRSFLAELLPEPGTSESEQQQYTPTFVKAKKRKAKVKRRAPETHRAYLERQAKAEADGYVFG